MKLELKAENETGIKSIKYQQIHSSKMQIKLKILVKKTPRWHNEEPPGNGVRSFFFVKKTPRLSKFYLLLDFLRDVQIVIWQIAQQFLQFPCHTLKLEDNGLCSSILKSRYIKFHRCTQTSFLHIYMPTEIQPS